MSTNLGAPGTSGFGRWRHPLCSNAIASIVAIALLVLGQPVNSEITAFGPALAAEADPFSADADYEETLKEIKRRLDEAAGMLFMGASADIEAILYELGEAESLVTIVLEPTQSPSLSPPEAGTVDPTIDPTSLNAYAMSCCVMALEANVAALTDPSTSYEVVGTKLRTIEALLPEYRALVEGME